MNSQPTTSDGSSIYSRIDDEMGPQEAQRLCGEFDRAIRDNPMMTSIDARTFVALRRRGDFSTGGVTSAPARWDTRETDAGIPPRFHGLDAWREMDGRLGHGAAVWLCGPMGVGKTHRACRIAEGWLVRGGVRFISSHELFERCASTYGTGMTPERAMRPYRDARLLVLDDVGKEPNDQRTLGRLFDLIDHRYSCQLPTVFTSQFNLSQLYERLSGRGDKETASAIASRLREWAHPVKMDGPDRRLGAVA